MACDSAFELEMEIEVPMNSFDAFSERNEQEKLAAQRAHAQAVLEELRQRKRNDGARWLKDLAVESLSESSAEPLSENTAYTTMEQMYSSLELMFDEFERYTSEFNLNAAGTDLLVSCTRPQCKLLTDAANSFDPTGTIMQQNSEYEGHVSTRQWSLVFMVKALSLELYLIPSDLLLAFSTGHGAETDYAPLLTLDAKLDKRGRFVFQMNDVDIDKSRMPELAQELFKDLVRVASGRSESIAEQAIAEQVAAAEPASSSSSPLIPDDFNPDLQGRPVSDIEAGFDAAECYDLTADVAEFDAAEIEALCEDVERNNPAMPVADERTSVNYPENLGIRDSRRIMFSPIDDEILGPSATLTEAFWKTSDLLSDAIEGELTRLSSAAARAAQMSDLGTMARCKRLVIALSALRDELTSQAIHLQSITDEHLAA